MLTAELTYRIGKITNQKPISSKEIQGGGYTPATRLIVTLQDGATIFVKVGVTALTANWLRQEHFVYENLSGAFIPDYVGWDDDGDQPILAIADLSGAFWPPLWSEERVQQVLDALSAISGESIPQITSLSSDSGLTECWADVAQDPKPFLSLGLATEAWLEAVLPTLLALPYNDIIQGTSLLHLDVRSDNICFVGDRALLIDWNNACYGNPDLDIAAWLPSLAAEGGPLPETILPDSGTLSALISGYMASKAGLPRIPDAPHVRDIQLTQAKTALPWTVRALGLPPLDGANAPS